MKRYHYRTARLYHIVIWSIILILSLNVIIKCVRIFGADALNETAESLESKLVSAVCNYMMQSNIPILNYTSGSEAEKNNFIFNAMIGSFPINRYIAIEESGSEDNLIEEQENIYLFAKHGLPTNQDFVKAIVDGTGLSKEAWGTQTADHAKGNGKTEEDSSQAMSIGALKGLMPIDIISGEVYLENEDATTPHSQEALGSINGEHFTLNQLENRQFLYNHFYIVDSAASVDDSLFNAKVLLGKDMTLKADNDKPQILIYHTHSQEAYIDSRKGEEADTVVGVGTYLTKLLEKKYGYHVVHDKSKYDLMSGTLDRNLAYNYACDGVEKILKKYPSIEVVIDLHRDGSKSKRVSKVDGKDVAQVMLFNGLSRNSKGDIAYLKNPNLEDNLAFSLQTQLIGREMYPGLMYKNYLHVYRYNLHLRKKSLLIELGTNYNTVEEAMNGIELFANVLNDVLKGESD